MERWPADRPPKMKGQVHAGVHVAPSPESHLCSWLSRPSCCRYQERYSRATGVNRRNEAASLPDMRGGVWTLTFQSGGHGSLLYNPLRSLVSNQFEQFERLALDWTKGCGQNLLVTWETEECSGASLQTQRLVCCLQLPISTK